MEDKYIIKVTRLKKVFGFAIPFKLYVDDKEIGSLSNGKSFECIVEKGVHKIVLKSTEKDVIEEVTLDKNHKVEIIITAAMGLIAARPNIKEVKYI
ncbi:MAG: hypothetical protein J5970_00605 [Bacilli bacterium]|nr:hypothetical protein [Bacilli bacterium]